MCELLRPRLLNCPVLLKNDLDFVVIADLRQQCPKALPLFVCLLAVKFSKASFPFRRYGWNYEKSSALILPKAI